MTINYLRELQELYEPIEQRLRELDFPLNSARMGTPEADPPVDPARAAIHLVTRLLAAEYSQKQTLAETKNTTLLEYYRPREGKRRLRMRARMLESLHPEQHVAVEAAVASHLTSEAHDYRALIAQIARLLTEAQSEQTMSAYKAFAVAHKAAFKEARTERTQSS